MGTMHAGRVERSQRLQRALEALRAAGTRGLTSMEWILAAQIVAPGTVAPELRRGGYNVVCECEGKVWRYRLVA